MLAKLAAAHLAVAACLDRLRAEVDSLGERGEVRLGPAGADGLVDRDPEQAGLLAACHLAEQLLVLAFLDVAVEVRDPAALLGAAVDREQPAVGELEPLALAAALEPVDEHAQRERLAGQHRPVQPAHLRAPGRVGDEDRLLHVAIDDHMLVRGSEVEARLRDLRPQSACRLPREVPVGGGVELAEHLDARLGAAASVVGLGRVEPRPQKARDLLAVEQLRGHALGLEL